MLSYSTDGENKPIPNLSFSMDFFRRGSMQAAWMAGNISRKRSIIKYRLFHLVLTSRMTECSGRPKDTERTQSVKPMVHL